MNPPAGYTARPSTQDDIETVARLIQTIDRHDEGIVEPVRGHIEDEWANPLFDAEQDTLVVAAESGGLAAYATAWGIEPSSSVEAWINIHPDHRGRGLATWLLGWAEARARRYLTEPGTSTLLRPSVSSEEGRAFLERFGYRHARTFWHMSRRLDGSERAGSPPDGVTIRAFRDGDGPALHGVLESAFEGHFGSEPMVYDAWEEATLRAPSSDLSLIFLAERGGQLVGALTTAIDVEEPWVAELGVLEAHRGSGVGGALLRRAFAELAARDWTIVKLNVDGENRSGATRLYESAGMTRGRSWDFYEKRIDAD